MIEKANSQSPVGRIAGLGREIRDYHQSSALATDGNMSKIMSRLIPNIDKLILSMDRTKLESQLALLDSNRDDKIRDFKYLNEGYKHHPDATHRANAEIVLAIFDKYGMEMINYDYLTESSSLESMFIDYTGVEAVAALTALPGATESLAAIVTAQQEFDAFQLEYAQANGSLKSEETASAYKRIVIKGINVELVNFLRSAICWDQATYEEYANTIAEMTKKSNAIVKAGSEEEEEVPTEE